MATIIESLRELASPALVSALSRQTTESEFAVSRGLSAAIPAIASTIAGRANDQGFVKNLADLATKTTAAPYPLEAMSASSPTGIDTTTPIGGWLSSLFGHNLSEVTDSVARYAGIRRSSAASLLSVAAPLVLGYLGRLMRSDKLSVGGLTDLLQGQRAQLASSLPTGFEMPEYVRAPYETARTDVKEKAGYDWSAPLIALLAALGIGGVIWWAAHRPVEVARVNVTTPLSKAVGTTGTLAGKFTRTLPGNVIITIPGAGSTEDRLSMYLASARPGATTIAFDRVGFDSRSAVLTARSNEQLDNIATILRAYPRATVTVAGHTDSVGSEAENLALSRARADAVAFRLKVGGVPSGRVHAMGYGSRSPMADNSTEGGRAQNRRVELEVAVR
jgi:OmpA-OmpF porin, OOP family